MKMLKLIREQSSEIFVEPKREKAIKKAEQDLRDAYRKLNDSEYGFNMNDVFDDLTLTKLQQIRNNLNDFMRKNKISIK